MYNFSIYIYIYIYREREREREIQTEHSTKLSIVFAHNYCNKFLKKRSDLYIDYFDYKINDKKQIKHPLNKNKHPKL